MKKLLKYVLSLKVLIFTILRVKDPEEMPYYVTFVPGFQSFQGECFQDTINDRN